MQEGSHINVFEEWMPGGSIAGLLDRHGPFTESVILRYVGLPFIFRSCLTTDLMGIFSVKYNHSEAVAINFYAFHIFRR